MASPVSAVDPTKAASQVIGADGGSQATKEALNAALKLARSKPAMSTATAIVCIACVPAAGAAFSPGMCISCGILLTKTLG